MVQCCECQRRTRINLLTYIQTHWYVEPRGCTGGDYWEQGEGQFVCPKCGHRNRLYFRKRDDGSLAYSGHPDAEKLTKLQCWFGTIDFVRVCEPDGEFARR